MKLSSGFLALLAICSVAAEPWAVIVSSSRFWFNYRHSANALLFYNMLRARGVPDANIVLMLADQHACSAKNPFPGEIFADDSLQDNLFDGSVDIDYRGADVTADMFVRVLTDRLPAHIPQSRRLRSNANSSVLVYMTGHSATGLLKFQDTQELPASRIAAALAAMHALARYGELLLIADTCHAAALFHDIRAPNVIAMGSSAAHEDSYSRRTAPAIGVHLVDRFSWHAVAAINAFSSRARPTLADFFASIRPTDVVSTPSLFTTAGRPLDKIPLSSFLSWSVPRPRPHTPPAWPAQDASAESTPDAYATTLHSTSPLTSHTPAINEHSVRDSTRHTLNQAPPHTSPAPTTHAALWAAALGAAVLAIVVLVF
eukprot:m.194872 g.194872  ORF g.194872 m.194872 type:complete len:372 (-) comp15454_c8_seq4:485-1600(-)